MMWRNRKNIVLSVVVAMALGGVVVGDALAQQKASERAAERRASRGTTAEAAKLFPNATRQEPSEKASARLSGQLQKMIDSYNDNDYAATREKADALLGNGAANGYEKSLAAQLGGQAAYNLDDVEGAKGYLQQAIDLGGLDNNGHYQSMLMLAQLQLQDEQYDVGLATLDKYLNETQSTKPEDLIVKGQALYQMERYAEAIPVLEQAIAGAEAPQGSWSQLLMVAYTDAGQPGKAIEVAQGLVAKSPGDKAAIQNLATVYMQADQMDEAARTMELLREQGLMTGSNEYQQLYSIYANMDGREADVIAVVNEGLDKGVLQADYQTYLALAQSYYYSDQPAAAIEAWQKAAPLSQDGETYLNLAKVLSGEGRTAEAKQAAQQALDKGVKRPEEARRIINE